MWRTPSSARWRRGKSAGVLEKEEVGNGAMVRAYIATEPGGPAKGWVTSAREGNDLLVTERALWELADKQPGFVKQKFHFFSFQLDGGRQQDRFFDRPYTSR